jgi:hypothetical protein
MTIAEGAQASGSEWGMAIASLYGIVILRELSILSMELSS